MENIDTEWNKHLNEIQGIRGLDILPTDGKDIMSKLIKALATVEDLPENLNEPESIKEVEAVNEYATRLADLFNEGCATAEAMLVGKQVERAYNDSLEDQGKTMSYFDKMRDYGLKESDF